MSNRGRKPAAIVTASHTVDRAPTAPTWLSKDAKAEWRRVGPIMISRRTLTEDNLGTLESYCIAQGTVREMARVIAVEGHIVMTDKGARKHPAVAIQSDASTRARLCAVELGLTPLSRSRPSVRTDATRDDETSPMGM